MKRKRPIKAAPRNSKRTQVRLAYEDGGEAAATDKARDLRVRPIRLARWLRKWQASRPRPRRPAVRPRRPTAKPAPVHEGAMVMMTWNTAVRGKLIKKGPEQSEIKFANGNTRIVVNEWMAPVPD